MPIPSSRPSFNKLLAARMKLKAEERSAAAAQKAADVVASGGPSTALGEDSEKEARCLAERGAAAHGSDVGPDAEAMSARPFAADCANDALREEVRKLYAAIFKKQAPREGA